MTIIYRIYQIIQEDIVESAGLSASGLDIYNICRDMRLHITDKDTEHEAIDFVVNAQAGEEYEIVKIYKR
jgi:hypothetical protein